MEGYLDQPNSDNLNNQDALKKASQKTNEVGGVWQNIENIKKQKIESQNILNRRGWDLLKEYESNIFKRINEQNLPLEDLKNKVQKEIHDLSQEMLIIKNNKDLSESFISTRIDLINHKISSLEKWLEKIILYSQVAQKIVENFVLLQEINEKEEDIPEEILKKINLN